MFKITAKKNNQKVNEVLKGQELRKVTGGMDDYPLKPKDRKSDKKNTLFPIPLPL